MTDVVRVEHLKVKYPRSRERAVDDVSFVLKEGSISVLLGPNGSGKSTIIKAILQLVDYKGKVEILGKPVSKSFKQIGYVPQRYGFDETFPINLTEFVSMGLAECSDSQKKKSQRVRQVISQVGLVRMDDTPLRSMSGGQLQRALLARALVHMPKLLILDEPEAGVDVGGEQMFYELLERLVKKEKLTALVASHELDVVYIYADQVICVNKSMVCSGRPKQVLDQNTFQKLYGRGLKFYGHTHHKEHRHR